MLEYGFAPISISLMETSSFLDNRAILNNFINFFSSMGGGFRSNSIARVEPSFERAFSNFEEFMRTPKYRRSLVRME